MKGHNIMNSIYKIELTKINHSLQESIQNYNVEAPSPDYGKYKAFGQFDSVSITKLNNFQISSFLDSYYHSIKNQYTGDSQIFYGFLPADQERTAKDNFFDNQEWTYQYIVFLDLQNYSVKTFKEELYKNPLYQNDHSFLILETFDKHSAIILIRKQTIHDCFSFIYAISSRYPECTWNIHYRLLTTINSELPQIKDEPINITMNFKINDPAAFHDFYEELYTQLIASSANNNYRSLIERNYFSGNSDASIHLYQYPSSLFFKLFYNNNILDRKNDKLYAAVRYTHTFVFLKLENSFPFTESHVANEKKYKTFQENIKKYLSALYKIEQKNCHTALTKETSAIITKFIQIIWDLNIYDKNSIYLIDVMLPALYEFVAQLETNPETNPATMYSCLEDMHHAFDTLLNTNFRAGHDYMTMPILYYTPAKIITFYSRFLRVLTQSVKQTFDKTDQTRYEFLLSPRLHTVADVVSYTNNDLTYMNRFLSIHLPISSLFDFKFTLISITHEAGHFLPDSKLRCRKERMDTLLRCTIYTVYISLMQNINDEKIDLETKNYILGILQNLYQTIIYNIYSSDNTDSITSSTRYYLINSEKFIRDTIIQYFYDSQNIIFNYIAHPEIASQIRNNIILLLQDNYEFSIANMYLHLERILRECYSDLFAIMILKLDFVDYFSALKKSLPEHMKLNDFLITRLAIIIKINDWDTEIDKSNDNVLLPVKELLKATNQESAQPLPLLSGVHNITVFNEILTYLEACKKEINNHLLKVDNIEKLQTYFFKINQAVSNNDLSSLSDIMDQINIDPDCLFALFDDILSEIEEKNRRI